MLGNGLCFRICDGNSKQNGSYQTDEDQRQKYGGRDGPHEIETAAEEDDGRDSTDGRERG